MLAYHFVGNTLRDGSPVPADGVVLKMDGPIYLCERGFHASLHPFDALQYAPGNVLCLVEMGGTIKHGTDKLVASERTIIKRVNAEQMLRKFACDMALSVAHLWDIPAAVKNYLTTQNETEADAAYAASYAACDAVYAAAEAAACDAAHAACDAVYAAAGAAAGVAAYAAYAASYAVYAAAGLRPGCALRAGVAAREKQKQDFLMRVEKLFSL